MAVRAAIRSGVTAIFNAFGDLIEVSVVQRRRGQIGSTGNTPVVSSGYNPRSGWSRSARNQPNQQTRQVDRAEDDNIAYNLADIDPFPTSPSPNPLPNSPAGTTRFALRTLVLTPKATLQDVLKGGRKADLEAMFRVQDMPTLDGETFIPSTKDMIRVNSNIYTIHEIDVDPTRTVITAKLMSTNQGGDVVNANN